MKAAVFLKGQNGTAEAFDGGRITLEASSVVRLPIGPERVARFERDGDDLVLVLDDGTVLVIENFFVETVDGRNDLVFEDADGVTWWAQYGKKWTGFDIVEINDLVAVPPFPLAALAGLGLLGGGAALAMGGGNTPPTGTAAPVTTPEDTPVDGQVIGYDKDGDDLTFTLRNDPEHGTVVVNPDGTYTYTPDPDYNGPDSFEVTVDDGNGGTAVVTVPITVTPVNDPATIIGDATGIAVEAGGGANGTSGTPNAGGTLTVLDVDSGEAVFQTPASIDGVYGSFAFDPATGVWTYVLDDDRAATQALTDGQVVTDELVVTSHDGTASETIVVTITGTNDVPTVTDDTGAVTEDDDGGTGVLTTTGQVTISDPDAGESLFDTATLTATGTPLGVLTIDANGNWAYEVDNTLPAVQSLALGETIVETWTVTSLDGTASSTIAVTITGTNDDPAVSGDSSGGVTEDGTATATGQLVVADVDTTNTHTWTVEGGTGDYGTLTVEATGEWTYNLDNTNADVQALGSGETMTETITVRVTDNDGGYDEQVVTITITGTNDAPVIAPGGDLAGAVTEITDGAAGENATRHSQTGTLTMSDPDTSDTLSDLAVSVVPGAATGYLGYFTHTVDTTTGAIDWTFEVDDSDLDALREGEVLTQTYDVTVTDPDGAATTETVTITITGSNDRPEPEDDASLIAAGGGDAIMNVVANDADDDAGEAATLLVTSVDGLAITPGGSVVLSGGRGTVALDAAGQQLAFTPGPNASGELVLPYVVDDGSGAANATASADWIINIAGVDISDDASPAGATTPDNVLSSIDDLANVAIGGHAAVGGSVTSLTISDGTNTVTVPAGSIIVNPDGSYSVTADLGGLDDGTLTVSASITDAVGNPVTVTDTILKDTVTPVAIDPVLIVDGVAPTIAGTGEPGASITLTVDGNTYNTTVAGDGTWSVTLPAPLGSSDTSISAAAEDIYGNTNSASRDVSGLVVTDEVAGQPEDVVVSESALTGGTAEGSGANVASSTFVLGTPAPALASIVIGGSVVGGALSGGTTVTLAQLINANVVPVDVATQYGMLSITGYDAGTGEISYTYTLSNNTEDHSDSSANDLVREAIQLAVVETDGDIRVSELVAAIEDDAPETPEADTPVSVVEGAATVGSAVGGDNLLANDALGADGGRVHQVTYTDRTGASATVTIGEGSLETVQTQYGSLTVASDGTWSYTPVDSADHVKATNDTELRDDFSYTTIDGDGDVSSGSATQQITVTDTVPVLGTPDDGSLDEQFLATGSNPDANQREVSGMLYLTPGEDDVDVTLTTTIPPAGLSSGNVDLVYELSPDKHTLTARKGVGGDTVFIVTLTDPTSALAGYTFELLGPIDHDGATSLDLTFGVEARDSDGDTSVADFTITVADDAPVATLERNIDEDSTGDSFTLSADLTAANTTVTQGGLPPTSSTTQGDGSVVHEFIHGTLTISAAGLVTYVPAPNFSGTEVFVFTTNDDGAAATSTVTINVAPVSDPASISVDDAAINTLEDTAIALGLNAPTITDSALSAGNNAISERIGEITLSGLPEGAILSWIGGTGGTYVIDATGSVTIVLSDAGLTEAGAMGAAGNLPMSRAQFETLMVLPPAHSSANFEVTYSVDSFEVDASGNKLAGVAGANSTTSVLVYVQADTDPATLTFDTGVDVSTVANADAIVFTGVTEADVTLKEDTSVDISGILAASFTDLDGSEIRSVTITNNTGSQIVVNGSTLDNGASLIVDAPGLSTSTTALPSIVIGGTGNFSGDLEGIEVTLNAQDYDSDGYLGNTGANVPGQLEADTTDNSVTLNLRVTPVADDVQVGDVTGEEDSPIAFLSRINVTDSSTGVGGTEVITQMSFEVPADWEVNAPASLPTGVIATAGLTGTTYTITFTAGDEADRETYLEGFTITPPNHDSSDVTIALNITTRDTSTVDGATVFDETTQIHDLTVVVTAVPERINPDGTTTDTDGNGTPDLTMTPGFEFSSPAQEDTWFNLNSDGFDLSLGWTNEDPSELTFARLTPELLSGDGTPTNAIGSMFRWTEGGVTQEVLFNGTPIDVPVGALDTLEFRATDNFSGQFRIRVQALTLDYDDDGVVGSGDYVEAVSGEAYLSNVLITPVADDVTLSLGARALGLEDTEIPLSIRPTSSDPSEVFNITISDIPVGAVLTYNGSVLPITGGSVTIEGFDSSLPLTLRPPLNSNDDFTLTVSAQSVDRLDVGGTIYEDVSAVETLTMQVEVKGVADVASVAVTPQAYIEAELDGGVDSVALADLVSVSLTDADGSETLTMQITGLPDGFGLSHGTPLTGPDVTGEDRVWVLRASQLGDVEILVPENFSGTVVFDLVPVTTENDGASLTGTAHAVTFTVEPSPEATITTGASLVEDVLQSISMGIVHQNGDTDETLEGVRIRVSDTEGDFTLYTGTPGSEAPLALAGLPIVDVGGVQYYELTAAQAQQLSAQGGAHLDGTLGGFDLFYRITDPGDGTVAPVTSDWIAGHFDLSATPVTDQPVLSLDNIDVGGGVGGSVTGSSVLVDTAGTQVTLGLNIAAPDDDGSEHLVRVIVEGVPDGVTVEGGELVGGGVWLLVYQGPQALSIGAGGLTLPVVFTVGTSAGGITDAPISIVVQTQDRGDQAGVTTSVLEDRLDWELTTSFTPGAPGLPPSIETWEYTDASTTEDISFQLSEMIDAEVLATTTTPSILTVTITDLPAGTEVSGMVRTVIAGVETWTASVMTLAVDDASAVQAKLDALMDSIVVTPRQDGNDNNLGSPFSFNATLTSAVAGGGGFETATISPYIPVDPVTDPADISIVLGAADPDGVLTETDTEIPLTVTVDNLADGAAGSIENGDLYLQIDGTNGLGAGVLTVGGVTYTPQTVTDVPGIPVGSYYVIGGVSMGDPVDMVFTPDTMTQGSLTVDAWVRNVETGATAMTSTGTTTLPVEISNDGVTFTSPGPVSGNEAADSTNASLIELNLGLALTDSDGSEEIVAVLLSNLPEGFLLYTGPSAGNASLAEMATNAGGSGGMNTWVLAGGGTPMPPYIGILPPQNWSGTLDSLQLTVTSGETALSDKRVDVLPIGEVTVNPVANGIELAPTNSFGTEGRIVPLNLNAAMADFEDASVAAAPDESVETVTLTLQGLGNFASFYVGTGIITSGISYDAGTDTYILTGLSQADLDALGFRQAASALTDQDAGTAGVQINVTARTVDGTDESAVVTGTATLRISSQLPTTGDDSLIWTGQAINGHAGEDTVHLRYGESLSGAQLAAQLRNIETLELGIEGTNSITDLTPEQVQAISDADNLLTIKGTAEDGVSLSGDWTDNGDGTYTGTLAGGGDVTLTVEDATVTPPIGGFSLLFAGGPMMMSFASFGGESFGLASLGTEPPAGETDEPATDPVRFDEVMSSGAADEDLTASLPEEQAPAPAPSASGSGDAAGADWNGYASALDDELQSGALYEV